MHSSLARALDGALAAAAQLAVAELAAARLPGGRSPVTGLGKTLIDAIPAPGIDMVVATAETMDKPLLKGSLGGGLVGLGALAGVGIRSTRSGAAMLAGSALVAGAAGASRRESATASSFAAGAAGAAVGAAGFGFLRARPGARARLLVALGALATGAAATAARAAQEKRFLARRAAVRLPRPADAAEPLPPGASFSIDGLTPLFTPPESFYVTDVQLPEPQIDPGAWRLRVGGMVERELELSLSDLLARDLIELDATLICVHNPVGGERVGSARWLGLPLAALLEEVGVEPDAEQLVARSVDGFTAGIPVAHIEGGSPALLAVAMNGQPLPPENGFPARLLVPGLWGADANTKWVTELELTTWDAVHDYWDRRGWPRKPTTVKPGSRIDVPRNRALLGVGETEIAGVAWAPPAGVKAVEVSIDGGEWQTAELSAEVAPTMWRQWRLSWAPAPGEHVLRVRAVGRGARQSGDPAPPYPTGSSGYHEIRVTVSERPPRTWDRWLSTTDAAADDLRGRIALAASAPPAWRQRGYPPAPRFPAPLPRHDKP